VGDAGLDLHALEPATIGPGERANIGTGIAVEIPPGHAGLVLPRSGLAAEHGIALVNSPGLIDSGYRGEVRVLLLNTDRARSFQIDPGDRIAQLLVTRISAAEPVAAVDLVELPAGTPMATGESPVRGEGGFGSSGR
jgi:dUTP pyrophosphatase